MTATGYIRGHAVHWDGILWRYEDSEPAEGWGGEARPCPACGELPTPEGYDACIGPLTDVTSACCGHGIEPPYAVGVRIA